MATPDPRIDAYIAKSAPFSRPILSYLREVVGNACPKGVETLKWGSPHLTYRGKLVCGMAAFKQHATFGFCTPRSASGMAGRSWARGRTARTPRWASSGA